MFVNDNKHSSLFVECKEKKWIAKKKSLIGFDTWESAVSLFRRESRHGVIRIYPVANHLLSFYLLAQWLCVIAIREQMTEMEWDDNQD